MPPSPDPDVATRAGTLMRELGAAMGGPQHDELCRAMHAHVAATILPLQADDALLDLLFASVEGNVETVGHLTRYELPVAEIGAPPAALAYARRVAQLDVRLADLLRAYRLGQQLVVDWALNEFSRLEPDREVVIEAGRRFAELTFSYVDAVCEQVVDVYTAERERCLTQRNSARAALVDELIKGGSPDLRSAESTLGFRLRQFVVAAVLWEDGSDEPGHHDLERTLAALAESLGAIGAPLFLPREQRGLVWGWIPLGRTNGPEDLAARSLPAASPAGVRVALGLPGAGPEGFRLSHLEALRAQRVAVLAAERGRPLTAYSHPEVRAAGALAADLEMTRRLVERALGPLAADTDAADRLRETLRVFLLEKGSFVAAGERLHLHKNSVRYRVEKAIAERGRPVDEDRLELELALIACRWLGTSVLRP